MAIPLWRQYTRLTPEQRREILERRRRRLDEASTREEILEVFQEDEREVREAYREETGAAAPRPEAAPAAADQAFDGFPTPNERDFGQSIGVENQRQLDSAVSLMQQLLQERADSRWESAPVNVRGARPEVTPEQAREALASGSNIATQIINSVR